jgi:hypothetical protein
MKHVCGFALAALLAASAALFSAPAHAQTQHPIVDPQTGIVIGHIKTITVPRAPGPDEPHLIYEVAHPMQPTLNLRWFARDINGVWYKMDEATYRCGGFAALSVTRRLTDPGPNKMTPPELVVRRIPLSTSARDGNQAPWHNWANGNLIKSETGSEIFLMENCQRRRIGPAAILGRGYLADANIRIVTDARFNAIPAGQPIPDPRAVTFRAPTINNKEVKVECVHSYPHMILRNKTPTMTYFTIDGPPVWRTSGDCRQVGNAYGVPGGDKKCTLFFQDEAEGDNIAAVVAHTAGETKTFAGSWPIMACCRWRSLEPELADTRDPGAGGVAGQAYAMTEEGVEISRDRQRNGTKWRGYEVTLERDGRMSSHNREKNSPVPFHPKQGWDQRECTIGSCGS